MLSYCAALCCVLPWASELSISYCMLWLYTAGLAVDCVCVTLYIVGFLYCFLL